MAKKRKISQGRIEAAYDWLWDASEEELRHYANQVTPSLQKAAKAFDLDPGNEGQREILVRILAWLVFGGGRKRGRPPMTYKWTPPREYKLGMHYSELKQERPNIKYSEAAKIIMKRYPNEYADCKERVLRPRLPGAYKYFVEESLRDQLGPPEEPPEMSDEEMEAMKAEIDAHYEERRAKFYRIK